MTDRDPTDDLLRDALRAAPAPESGHLDNATLAALLDGALDPKARETAESHLAACPECRELAFEAAEASAAGSEVRETGSRNVLTAHPSRWRRRSEAALALAAALVLGIGSVILFQSLGAAPDLDHLGVTAAELDGAGSAVRSSARRALAGRFGPVAGLPEPEDLGGEAILRGEADPAAPLPIAPRWTAVRDERPKLVWRTETPADSWEVLVIDESETLVVAFEPAFEPALEPALEMAGGEIENREARLAADLPPETRLEAGTVYLWKVNARRAEGVASSPWVPFRVLTPAEAEALGDQLGAAGGDPFLEASVLAAWGLDRPALEALARVPAAAAGRPEVTSFARTLLERHQLPESAIEDELATRLEER